jgi:hypothetical protein
MALMISYAVFSRASSDYGENFVGTLLTQLMANISQGV